MSDLQARVSQLWIYPVKSCGGVSVLSANLTETGLEWDRAWMVVDAQGDFVSQREAPRMALIEPKMRHLEMVLRAPGMLALHVSLHEAEEPVQVTVWGETVKAYDMGALAGQWFTDFLSQTEEGRALGPLRLVRFDPEFQRASSTKWTQGVQALNQFSDGYPLLVLSEAALAEFNERLSAQGQSPVDMARFRPNLVLSEVAAHTEDHAKALTIVTDQRSVTLRPVKPCARCSIPNVDPQTAELQPQVSAVLASYRQDARLEGAVTFGMNAIVTEGLVPADSDEPEAVLKVGQAVQVQVF